MHMKKSEAIAKYYGDIAAAMAERYRAVIECDGRIQYKIYVWEDGEIECLEGVQGDSTWLQARDMEPRELYYVCTIDAPCFDAWDYTDHFAPDDEAEREAERKEIIDYLVAEYETNVADVLDDIISDAEREEKNSICC